MLAFACPVCARLVTFESTSCLNCASPLAYDRTTRRMGVPVADPGNGSRLCANALIAGCNWLADRAGELCASCSLTRKRPNDADAAGMTGFAEAEAAKRWLLFDLHELGLPVESRAEREGGLAFDLLSSAGGPVTTGHADGVITLDLAEADAAQREPRRVEFDEPYRTVLGTLRHEIGHYYQPLIVPPSAEPRMRELFGDEREDYAAAVEEHYASGAPSGWQQSFISAYATTHPWEDWAETFAHYLHIRDTMQTAAAYGLSVAGPAIPLADEAPLDSDPSSVSEGQETLREWIPLTFALNQISRSMGEPDTYPFVLPPPVMEKLAFIDGLVRGLAR